MSLIKHFLDLFLKKATKASIYLEEHPFKKGDLITGKDRNYPRSIYEVSSVNPYKIKLVSFEGFIAKKRNEINLDSPNYGLSIQNYRLATKEEIKKSREPRSLR